MICLETPGKPTDGQANIRIRTMGGGDYAESADAREGQREFCVRSGWL